MTPTEAAAHLDGNEYGSEGSKELFTAMKESGLVAVFGASDDLMEFRGAINDEVGCYGGGTAFLTREGLLTNECDDENCPHFKRLREKATPLHAVWGEGGFSFTYEFSIQHATFVIKEDGDTYCEGIVFALDAVPAVTMAQTIPDGENCNGQP